MKVEIESVKMKRSYLFLLIVGIIVVAFNLRPALTSVGPLIGLIRDDLELSNWSAGLLTSLPLIAFAIISPLAPRLANRYSYEIALLLGMIFLFIGISVRSISVILLLFTGTLLVGVGIAILNVLLPGFIKDKFPNKVGLMTSIYSTAMGTFAAAASGLSIPLATGMNLGWQVALFVWATPSIIGILIWTYLAKTRTKDTQLEVKAIKSDNNRMWRSPLAWQVACFMGFQSFLFYVTISWLPEILHSSGVSMATAGWMLSFTQFIGLPASFLVPVLAERFKSQRVIVLIVTLSIFIGYGMLLIGGSMAWMIVSTIFIGLGLSGTFALALTLLGLRARTSKHAAELSGMAQSLGYALAAAGPIIIGYLFDITVSWTIPIATILVVSMIVTFFGLAAGRNRYVLEERS
ncbi:MFS transporter [Oceanobacillus piezotolerans]|uniref:MFS transporter n=1 Tax=Oceanobacillus piezotolerans TaxID=2448030 RepID=A0A498D8B0_9BACI|nr:MFS transporter [Oceanobacillus piezotolerans]RLL46945.1 MFS transporter [Oceanobacillus piezotolerans]